MKKAAKLKQNMLGCIEDQKKAMAGDHSGMVPYHSFILGELSKSELDAVERFIKSFDDKHP